MVVVIVTQREKFSKIDTLKTLVPVEIGKLPLELVLVASRVWASLVERPKDHAERNSLGLFFSQFRV